MNTIKPQFNVIEKVMQCTLCKSNFHREAKIVRVMEYWGHRKLALFFNFLHKKGFKRERSSKFFCYLSVNYEVICTTSSFLLRCSSLSTMWFILFKALFISSPSLVFANTSSLNSFSSSVLFSTTSTRISSSDSWVLVKLVSRCRYRCEPSSFTKICYFTF